MRPAWMTCSRPRSERPRAKRGSRSAIERRIGRMALEALAGRGEGAVQARPVLVRQHGPAKQPHEHLGERRGRVLDPRAARGVPAVPRRRQRGRPHQRHAGDAGGGDDAEEEERHRAERAEVGARGRPGMRAEEGVRRAAADAGRAGRPEADHGAGQGESPHRKAHGSARVGDVACRVRVPAASPGRRPRRP